MDPTTIVIVVIVLVVLLLIAAKMAIRIVKPVRAGRAVPARPGHRSQGAGPAADHPARRRAARGCRLRIVTMPIQSQGIITRDNVSVDVSAVAYYRVVDAVKSVVAIENVAAAIDQIAQTTLRKVVGQHTLDETLSETDRINVDIHEILDVATDRVGRRGHPGGAQGHPAARQHEAGDGPPGRGRAREAREDHRRRRRSRSPPPRSGTPPTP